MKYYKNIRLIYIAAGISMAVLFIMGVFYLEQSRVQVHYIDAVEHTYKVLSAINTCEKILVDAESAQRGHLLTGETNYQADFDYALSLIDSSLNEIGKLTADNSSQKIHYLQLVKFVGSRVKY